MPFSKLYHYLYLLFIAPGFFSLSFYGTRSVNNENAHVWIFDLLKETKTKALKREQMIVSSDSL